MSYLDNLIQTKQDYRTYKRNLEQARRQFENELSDINRCIKNDQKTFELITYWNKSSPSYSNGFKPKAEAYADSEKTFTSFISSAIEIVDDAISTYESEIDSLTNQISQERERLRKS